MGGADLGEGGHTLRLDWQRGVLWERRGLLWRNWRGGGLSWRS